MPFTLTLYSTVGFTVSAVIVAVAFSEVSPSNVLVAVTVPTGNKPLLAS
ncbi:hypothetical protein [Streptococcus salivarius]